MTSTERLYEHARLPRVYRADVVDLERLDTEGRGDALVAARAFATGEILGLLLTGDLGVGKSTIAAAAAKAYMARAGYWPLKWVHIANLCTDLLGDPEERAAARDALKSTSQIRPTALVLDDLDKTRPSPFAAEVIMAAVEAAVTDLRPLIVTTNLPLSGLARHWPQPFGGAIASRLVGYCARFTLTGPDRRMGAAS